LLAGEYRVPSQSMTGGVLRVKVYTGVQTVIGHSYDEFENLPSKMTLPHFLWKFVTAECSLSSGEPRRRCENF
jgi:hypothetical protein